MLLLLRVVGKSSVKGLVSVYVADVIPRWDMLCFISSLLMIEKSHKNIRGVGSWELGKLNLGRLEWVVKVAHYYSYTVVAFIFLLLFLNTCSKGLMTVLVEYHSKRPAPLH